MQTKPDFTVRDATMTQSGRFIRLFGEHAPDEEGKVHSNTILVKASQFQKMPRTAVEEEGVAREKVKGLIDSVIHGVLLRNENLAKEGEEKSWVSFLASGKITVITGEEFNYEEYPTRPDFTVKDANVTQSGKFIRLFGEYAPDEEGKTRGGSILVESEQFQKMQRTKVEENGKTREKIDGLIGAVISTPALKFKNTAKEGEEPSWLSILHEGKITFLNTGKTFNYKETPFQPKEQKDEQHQYQDAGSQAPAPGM